MDLLVDLARPTVGLITNVGKDHLEFLGTPEGVLDVNRKLFDALTRKSGTAVINLEDPLLKGFAGKLPCKTMTYGRLPEAQVRADRLLRVARGAFCALRLFLGKDKHATSLSKREREKSRSSMRWRPRPAHCAGRFFERAILSRGWSRFKPARDAHGSADERRPDGTTIVNDAYNANPSSMQASIESFGCSLFWIGQSWLVLGRHA